LIPADCRHWVRLVERGYTSNPSKDEARVEVEVESRKSSAEGSVVRCIEFDLILMCVAQAAGVE